MCDGYVRCPAVRRPKYRRDFYEKTMTRKTVTRRGAKGLAPFQAQRS